MRNVFTGRARGGGGEKASKVFFLLWCVSAGGSITWGGEDQGSPEATLINEKRTWCPVYIYTRETQHHTFCPLKSCHSEFFHTRLNCILAEKNGPFVVSRTTSYSNATTSTHTNFYTTLIYTFASSRFIFSRSTICSVYA